MLSILECLPVALVAAVLAALLAAEAGLLVGVFLPGGTAVIALGATSVPAPLAVAVVTVATLAGGWFGLLRGRKWAAGSPLDRAPDHRLGRRLAGLADRATRPGLGRGRSILVAGVGQGFGGSRTLTPRLLGARGVQPARWVLGAAPVAVVWSATLVTAGDVGAEALAAVDPSPLLLVAVLATAVLVAALRSTLRRRRRLRDQPA